MKPVKAEAKQIPPSGKSDETSEHQRGANAKSTREFAIRYALVAHCGQNLTASLIESIVRNLVREMESSPVAWAFSGESPAAALQSRVGELEQKLADAEDLMTNADERESELYWRKQYEEACIKIAEQHEEIARLQSVLMPGEKEGDK